MPCGKKIIPVFLLINFFYISSSKGTKFLDQLQVEKESIKKILTKTNPDQKELLIGKNFIRLYNQLNGNVISTKKINNLNKMIDASSSFNIFKKWINNISNIAKIKNFSSFYKICPPLIDGYSSSLNNKILWRPLKKTCYNIFWKLQKKTIKIDKKTLNFISKYIDHLLLKKHRQQIIKLLKKTKNNKKIYIILSNIILNNYIKNKTPLPLIIKRNIHLPKNILNIFTSIQDKGKYSLYLVKRKLKSFTKRIKFLLTQKKTNHLLLSQTVDSLIAFIVKNNNKNNNYYIWSKLNYLGKTFLNNRHFNYSKKINKMALEFSPPDKYYETIFNLVWIEITQNKYSKAFELIKKHKITDNFSEISPRLSFWMAYTMKRMKKNVLAKKYFSKTTAKSPLAFYSIMASKMINNFSNINKGLNIIEDNKLSPDKPFTINSISGPIKNIIKRLQIWNKLNCPLFIELENDILSKIKNTNLFLTKSEKNNTILLISYILSDLGNYIQSFNLIYEAMNNGVVLSNQSILKALFPTPYLKQIKLLEYDLDPIIILSLIRQESAFNPKARSPVGATGLMQLMPYTAKSIKKKVSSYDLKDPIINIKIGIKYFKKLLKKYNGNLAHALIAYNAGENNLRKWKKKIFTHDSLLYLIESIPYRETRKYLQLVFRNIFFYKTLEKHKKKSTKIDTFFDVSLATNN